MSTTDPASQVTPVLRLGGLLRMLDGVEALASYDKDGDYSVFAPLLERDGLPRERAALLHEAAYLERLHHAEAASQQLKRVMPALQNHQGPFLLLFRQQLLERLSWFRAPSRHERELRLADAYLARRGYVRSTILLQEALLSRETASLVHGVAPSNDRVAETVSREGSLRERLQALREQLFGRR